MTIVSKSLLAVLLLCQVVQAAELDVCELKVPADGKTEATAALQGLLDSGRTSLFFPEGQYLLGPVRVPGGARLIFHARAQIIPVPEKINYKREITVKGMKRVDERKHPLFQVVGNDVRMEGLQFDFSLGGREKDPAPVQTLVYAEGSNDVVISRFRVWNTVFLDRRRIRLLDAYNCRNVTVENSSAEKISFMAYSQQCANVIVRGNWMIDGDAMTTFAWGSENLRHHDNWSRQVGYQCVWRGGSPDPSRKAPRVPLGTANVVHRGVKLEDANFFPHTRGSYDVLVQNNYSEYGVALCWGNKSRQVLVEGNIARYMYDYSFGSEGDENAVFANNISINSSVAGFSVLFWGEKLVFTGNIVLVRHEEPYVKEFARLNKAGQPLRQSFYSGQFMRLHHGPPNPEDKYGNGSVIVSGNLFVNEFAERPSGICIEAGRDVLFTGNKVINGLLRKYDEVERLKAADVANDSDEFASQSVAKKEEGEIVERRRVGTDLSRLTVTSNEFITRQAGDKPMVVVNGSVSSVIIRDNVFRKEEPYLKFTDEQLAREKELPRLMLYSDDNLDAREYTNSKPDTAISIAPFTSANFVVQGNFIQGWKKSITANNTAVAGKSSFVVTGNTVDGAISADGDAARTVKNVADNIELPAGLPGR